MKINLMLLILAMTIFMALGAVQQKKREGKAPSKSLTDTADSIGKCGTAERDSVEFENLPYYDNNDYLETLLDSLDYPPDQTLNRSGGISPMNYTNYPTRYWIPVKFWIIRNSNGGEGATENDIRLMLQSVNNDFRNNNTLIQFYQKCDIGYIDNSAYLDLSDSEARALARDNEDAGAVNVFLGHVLDENAGGIHYANGPISFDPYKAIFLSRPAYQWAYNVMTHELGHYFDLDHTHQFNDKGRCRREPVSRTRKYALISFCKPIGSRTMCESTGDALRDTPADPDLRDNASCSSYNLGGVDHFGDPYNDNPPSLSNFMSYNRASCRSTFTRLQVAVMLNAIERNMLHVSNRVAWSNASSMFDTYEPDNNAATAGNIIRCEVQERNFHMQLNSGISFSSCDADWVRYVASANETVDVYTSAVQGRATVNTSLFIYDSANNLIGSNDDKASGDIYSHVSLTTTASTTYFIKIVNNSSTSGGFYKLSVGKDMAGVSISGPTQFCNTQTYTIPNLPTGSTVTWTVSDDNYVSKSTSGNDVTLGNLTGNMGMQIVLTATISTICGNVEINKQIILGGASVSWVTFRNGAGGEGYFCTSHSGNTFEPIIPEGAPAPQHFEVKMYSYPSLTLVHHQTYTYGGAQLLNFMGTNAYYVFEIRAYDVNCGYSEWFPYEVEFTNCMSERQAYNIYPNPASNVINVDLGGGNTAAKSVANAKPKEYEVRLFDTKGRLKLKTVSHGLKAQLNTSSLPSANYFIHINREGEDEVIRKQVIIRN